MAFFDCEHVRLMLAVPETAQSDHPSAIPCFRVPDRRSTYEVLKARDVEFLGVPHPVGSLDDREVWMAFLSGPG